MSKYRVLDDSKNKYDAGILMEEEIVDPTGVTLEFASQDKSHDSGKATVTISGNPSTETVLIEKGTEWEVINDDEVSFYPTVSVNIQFINNTQSIIEISNVKVIYENKSKVISNGTIQVNPGNSNSVTSSESGFVSNPFMLYLYSFELRKL